MSVSNDSSSVRKNFQESVVVRPVESRYTVKNLFDLNNAKRAYASPLATIALIDLNAFFAQVEQLRLNYSTDDPVVCAQWQSLIAISYAARKYGINRMDTIASAKSKCPNLIIAHAAVFKKGESNWAYTNYMPNQTTHKVSLDPYRRESRKIIKVYQKHCDLVQKASVDECYLDLGRIVYKRLIEFFPYLSTLQDSTTLPTIPSEMPDSISFIGETIKDRKTNDGEDTDVQFNPSIVSDWDDICMMIGSKILYEIRCDVYQQLGYTTSGGLGRNKIIAKLSGGFKKPDNQTIIQTSQINNFLTNFELTDLTSMGGKTGELVLQKLQVPYDEDSISYIRENFTLRDLEKALEDDNQLATKVYDIVRGDNKQELSYRVDIKSMMSSKNFSNEINRLSDAEDWIKVFVGDVYNRMIELDEENLNIVHMEKSHKATLRRPKTLSVTFTTANYQKFSKQTQISVVRSLDTLKGNIEATSIKLLRELIDTNTSVSSLNDGKNIKDLINEQKSRINISPIIKMAIGVSNFVVLDDTSSIDSLMEKRTLTSSTKPSTPNKGQESYDEIAQIKGNVGEQYIDRIHGNEYSVESTSYQRDTPESDNKHPNSSFSNLERKRGATAPSSYLSETSPKKKLKKRSNKVDYNELKSEILQSGVCPLCAETEVSVDEHVDYHIALDLSIKMNGTTHSKAPESPKGKRKNGKVQSKLPF